MAGSILNDLVLHVCRRTVADASPVERLGCGDSGSLGNADRGRVDEAQAGVGAITEEGEESANAADYTILRDERREVA